VEKNLIVEYHVIKYYVVLHVVLVVLPVVAAVNAVDHVRLHQTGVLLTLPASCGPTCTTEEQQTESRQRVETIKRLKQVIIHMFMLKPVRSTAKIEGLSKT